MKHAKNVRASNWVEFHHIWYSDRLVNSDISASNRADRPRRVGKYSHIPFQIMPFAQGRKNWSPAPPMSRWVVEDQFFRPPGPSCQSHSNLEKWGLTRKRVSVLQFLFFYKVLLVLVFNCFTFFLIFLFSFLQSLIKPPYFGKFHIWNQVWYKISEP